MIGFRVDANEKIATGHLMRCLSIAAQVRKQGNDCVFFLAENKCTDLLRDRKFQYEILNTDYCNMEEELPLLSERLAKYDLSWMVVDSYQITEKYIQILNSLVPVMGLDVPSDKKYDIAAILNYSHLGPDKDLEKLYENQGTMLLTGLQYAPLREEFERSNASKHPKKQILITSGGTDPYHISYQVTKELLSNSFFDDYSFCVVVGKMSEDEKVIQELNSDRVTVRKNAQNMAELMRESQVAFTAGGSTSIELCACMTPAVCYSFVDNQIPFSRVLADNGVVRYIGDIRDLKDSFAKCAVEQIRDALENQFVVDPEICDGLGASRVAEILNR